ncbi:toxin-antitoxin system YwqK family antitoxin [Flaviaesturariibacter terrae]
MARQVRLHASLALLLAGCASAPQDAGSYNAATLSLENRAGIYYSDGRPFSGRVFELAPNGRDSVSSIAYCNGLEEGEWRRYYPGNRLAESRFFDKGRKTGTMRSFWDNGRPKLEYHFKEGEYEGTAREWNRAGALIAEHTYRAGYEEGPQRLWYDNGKTRANYVIRNGRRYGLLGTKNCVNVSDSVFRF